ncbi:hypothetical protein [Enterococcus rivorum]|uniref:hypothetical protein n=1 Tax=Enterococcus rivorum TaxID=762845 RepID=UPI0036266169
MKTDQGEEIKVTSLRPKIGVNWLAELAAKRERVARLEEYRHLESQRENQYQRTQQQQNLSR